MRLLGRQSCLAPQSQQFVAANSCSNLLHAATFVARQLLPNQRSTFAQQVLSVYVSKLYWKLSRRHLILMLSVSRAIGTSVCRQIAHIISNKTKMCKLWRECCWSVDWRTGCWWTDWTHHQWANLSAVCASMTRRRHITCRCTSVVEARPQSLPSLPPQ